MFYNSKRRHGSSDQMPPTEYENQYYQRLRSRLDYPWRFEFFFADSISLMWSRVFPAPLIRAQAVLLSMWSKKAIAV